MPPRGSSKKQTAKPMQVTKGTPTAPKTTVKSRTPKSETSLKEKASPLSVKGPVDVSTIVVQEVEMDHRTSEDAGNDSAMAPKSMVVEMENASNVCLARQEAESSGRTSSTDVEPVVPAADTDKVDTATKKKKKVIRKVITVVRKKIPVSRKKSALEENPNAITTNLVKPSLDKNDQVTMAQKEEKDMEKKTEPSEKPAKANNSAKVIKKKTGPSQKLAEACNSVKDIKKKAEPSEKPDGAHNSAKNTEPSEPHNSVVQSGEKPLSGEEMGVDLWVDECEIAERRKKRMTEIFVGGLDKEVKEDDVRKVFEKVGELVEVRLMKNIQTGKNKGYAFLRYATYEEAQRAIKELSHTEVCGKQCSVSPLEDKHTIFLGSIDKKWKKEDLMRVLHEIGVENIFTVYLMMDHNNPGCNRGFAFVELETNKDAHNAFKKLQKTDALGKGRNITVAWAEPLNDPSEEEMQKVKTVYANGVPSSWDEEKIKKHFSKFGEIEKIKLGKDMQNPKRKDVAFVDYISRESALACIQSFDKEEFVDEGSKVNIKVMLAKPLKKNNQSKAKPKMTSDMQAKQTRKDAYERPIQSTVPATRGNFISRGTPGSTRNSFTSEGRNPSSLHETNSSTKLELIKVLREQASWRQGTSDFGTASTPGDYFHGLAGGKRPISALDEDFYSDPRAYPRARLDSSFPYTSTSYSTGTYSYGGSGTSLSSYAPHSTEYGTGSYPTTIGSSVTGRMPYGRDPYGTGPSIRY